MKKIKIFLFLAVFFGFSTLGWAKEAILLHISDSHIILEPAGSKTSVSLARAMTTVREIKAKNPNTEVLIVHSGDFLAPSETSRIFKGEDVVKSLEAFGVSMATLGNHEFDYSLPVLLERAKQAKFPFLSANIVNDQGQPFAEFKPYVIRNVGGIRIAFIGLTTPDQSMMTVRKFGDPVQITDPVAAAKKAVAEIRGQGLADMVVALAHLEMEEDEAVLKNVPGIDLLLGGHLHIRKKSDVDGIPFLKVRDDLRDIGVVRLQQADDSSVVKIETDLVAVTRDVPLDAELEKTLNEIREQSKAVNSRVVAQLTESFDGTWAGLQTEAITGSAKLGTWAVDLFRQGLNGEVAFMNLGTVARANRIMGPGLITEGDVNGLFPWSDPPVLIQATGKDVRKKITQMLDAAVDEILEARIKDPNSGYSGKFPIVAGLEIEWDWSRPRGDRITKLNYQGVPLSDDQKLKTVVNLYIYNSDPDLRQLALLVTPIQSEFEVLLGQIKKNYPVVVEQEVVLKPCEKPLK